MQIALLGPCKTDFFRKAFDIALEGAPMGQAQTPVGPIAVELIARGHEVSIVTLDTAADEPMRFKEGPLDIRYLPFRGHGKYRARVRTRDLFAEEIKWLEREVRAIAPDVVHAHWTYEFAEGGRRAAYPLLVTAHDAPYRVLWLFRNAYRAARLVMAARTIMRLEYLSAVAPYLLPNMRALGFWGKIPVIPNGLDLVRLPASCKRLEVGERVVIAAVGDSGDLKNISAVVKAFKAISKAVPRAELHLFGSGLDDAYANGQAGMIGHGPVPHHELVAFHKQHTQLLIHPSKEEVCPVAVLEAMALGIPAIGGHKSGGVPYVFGDALKACLVDINDPGAIADKAIEILQNPALYAALSQKARRNIEQRFDIRLVVDQYESIYRAIIETAQGKISA